MTRRRWLHGHSLAQDGSKSGGVTARVARLGLLAALTASLILSVSTAAWAVPSETPQDTVDPNGRVHAVVQVGGTIYIGGDFTAVDGTARNHLAAIDASTGALTSWNPGASARVRALEAGANGSVYAGGDFAMVGASAGGRSPKSTRMGW